METDTKENKLFIRHPAVKTTIKRLIVGEYVQENDFSPNYLLTKDDQKIYRLNIMAIIVNKESQGSITNILVEDGTEKIIIRSFEENKNIDGLQIGNVILVIGKLRIYNQEKYISPEIIKKIDISWLKLRLLELDEFKKLKSKDMINIIKEEKNGEKDKENKINENSKILIKETIKLQEKNDMIFEKKIEKKTKEENQQNIEEDIIEENIEIDKLLPVQKLSKLISELDKGNGVPIEEIIEVSPLEKTEELLEKMLENGDIFQNMPGKVKVL
ncbi:MAG: hypothetical protein ABH824_01755 [Nanoarchaeota archaeon]|nr:hypothetical protein [Nanoarchaeota archaeon]MBU1631796.1 hypothetical protein [Nanoarchaeota archaeon]MBU1876588.1 hypothetical protein [Nanoarchaeota archaeon]